MTAAGAAAVTHYLFFIFLLSFSFFLLCKRRAQLDAIVVVLSFVFSADLLIVLRQTIQSQRGNISPRVFCSSLTHCVPFCFCFCFFYRVLHSLRTSFFSTIQHHTHDSCVQLFIG
jgi:hypothetical protein